MSTKDIDVVVNCSGGVACSWTRLDIAWTITKRGNAFYASSATILAPLAEDPITVIWLIIRPPLHRQRDDVDFVSYHLPMLINSTKDVGFAIDDCEGVVFSREECRTGNPREGGIVRWCWLCNAICYTSFDCCTHSLLDSYCCCCYLHD